MKQVAGRLRLDLAQYRELEAFAEFGSELDRASQAQLNRGARLVELLKQPQYQPREVDREVIGIWVVTSGLCDDIPVADVGRFEAEFGEFLSQKHSEIGEQIRKEGSLPEELEDTLREAAEEFKKQFRSSGEHAPPKEAEADELEDEEHEKLKRRVPPKPKDQR
jgi:F-type H+-transporting ATPase subunit alpha